MNATEEKRSADAKRQARAQLNTIIELVDKLQWLNERENDRATVEIEEGYPLDREGVEQYAYENALSVCVRRAAWRTLDDPDTKPDEFQILLCCGGPHVEIRGELNEHMEPENATLHYQDWFTGLIEFRDFADMEQGKLNEYCQLFYFGE